MRKRFKFSLISALLGIVALFTVAGCSLNKSEEEIKEQYNLNACVTYYGNGGYFNNKAEKTEVTLWLDANAAYPYNVPSDNAELNAESDHKFGKGTMEISRKGYVFNGWYYALLDEETGEVARDEAGNVCLGELVDFKKQINVGDQLYFVAKWTKKEVVEIRLVSDISFTATVEKVDAEGNQVKDGNGIIETESKEVKTGDLLMQKEYSTTDKTVKLTYSSEPAKNAAGASFLAYYSDKECTKMLSGGALTVRPLGEGKNQVVYAKYIVGDWKVIRSNEDYTKMFTSANMDGNYWLMADLDLTGKTITPKTSFSGNIQGNGYTIKGLEVSAPKGSVSENSTKSIFGEVKATAKISDLTIEDWTLSLETNAATKNVTTYLLFSEVEDGAAFENLTVKGGGLTVTKKTEVTILNIQGQQVGEEWIWDDKNYLFGGLGTDEAFLTKYSGITVVEDAKPTLTIINK